MVNLIFKKTSFFYMKNKFIDDMKQEYIFIFMKEYALKSTMKSLYESISAILWINKCSDRFYSIKG